MHRFAALALTAAMTALAACQIDDATTGEDPCNARSHQGLIGQDVTDPDALRALGPTVRLIYPDSAVTMDHQPARLNVVIDTANRIGELRCG